MNRLNLNIRLLIAFVVLLAGTAASVTFFRRQQPLPYRDTMEEAVALTEKMFGVIERLKQDRNIVSDAHSNVPNNFMIGDEWSDITTTLGSLEAKETSTNPDFAALIVRLLHEAGITGGEKVGVIISGSFPSLAISALTALQTMGIEPVVMSSMGASTYGANQSGATWIDMETALRRGGMKFKSILVSAGATGDNGTGLSPEGMAIIGNAANRNRVDLYIPENLQESIMRREAIFRAANISLLINIGGNEAALGDCAHALGIPNGLNYEMNHCDDPDRGLISRLNEAGIPFINMLDIKDLASRYGIAISPGTKYSESTNLYSTTNTNRVMLAFILAISLVPLFFLRKRK
ncbi:MAG: poly-gamma-glutamate system protein [Bacteroidales bacterium]|nr:poly-gamma-glutamate system protein [Bacteroidales bacterium]MDT8372604.1 poly-gamma-glutamate system protein [Bacteroidales bacterium]